MRRCLTCSLSSAELWCATFDLQCCGLFHHPPPATRRVTNQTLRLAKLIPVKVNSTGKADRMAVIAAHIPPELGYGI